MNSVAPSHSLNSEKTIPSEVPFKEDTEAANHTVVDMVTTEDMVATSHMVTEVATVVATSHTEVAEATKVATKGATRLAAIEVEPRAASPTTEPCSWATWASIAKRLM